MFFPSPLYINNDRALKQRKPSPNRDEGLLLQNLQHEFLFYGHCAMTNFDKANETV